MSQMITFEQQMEQQRIAHANWIRSLEKGKPAVYFGRWSQKIMVSVARLTAKHIITVDDRGVENRFWRDTGAEVGNTSGIIRPYTKSIKDEMETVRK